MKQFLTIVVLGGVLYLVYRGSNAWRDFSQKQKAADRQRMGLPAEPTPAQPAKLPGMNPTYEASLEKSLETAKNGGAAALKSWLTQYRVYVNDPRLADIELDYVLLVSRTDLAEAKRVFADVKRRTPPTSPIHERLNRLAKTFE
jgi:hypothetical protein